MAANQIPEMKQNEPGLRKQLSPMHVWAIAFGCVIGWGSFINPGKKFLPNSGVAGTAIAMFLGAVVMMILTNVPMNSTAIGLIVDGLDGTKDILKFGFHYQIAGFDVWMGEMFFAMAILILFGTLNIIGVKKAGIVQTVLACLLAVSVLTLTISALVSDKASIANMAPWWGFNKSEAVAAYTNGTFQSIDEFSHGGTMGIASAILATFAIAPWAYVGFDTIPQAAEEFKFSYKKVSLIMFVAILFGCFVYTANNTIAAAALSNWPELIIEAKSTPWLLLAAAEMLLGTPGKILVGVAVSCAVLSGIMGFYLASSRLMYSMSREGYLPKWFGKIEPKYGTPKNAMLFCIVISLSGPILGREALGWFVDMAAIGASIGYFFTAAATLVTLKRYGDGSAFLKVMGIIGVIFSVTFMILQLIPIPGLSGVHFGKESYIMLIVWTVLGAAFYIRQRSQFEKQ